MNRPRPKPGPTRERPIAIEDVAAAAGVSIATVSRFLNKPGLVAPATAERVGRAVEKLGYRPNPFAQGLMTRRSQIVGILLPDVHGEFYSELLRGADGEAHRRGQHLLVSSEWVPRDPARSGTPSRGRSAEGGPQTRRTAVGGSDRALAPLFRLIDGLAVMITEPNEHLWRQVQDSGLPVVVLDADPKDPGAYSIVVDNAAGAAEATGHLLESVPASRCFFVGGPGENFDSVQRAEAFLGALRGAGHKPRRDQTAFGEYSFDWGQRWAQTMIAAGAPQGPIGALAGNDEIAFGLMRAFQDAGRHVPRDIRIIGFDDTRLASLLRPALSTVRVPMAEIGAAAIAILIDRIENKDGHTRSVRIPTTLIIRESSRA